ncbi:MAG: BrnT family toxin [Acidobacteriia bacterium]|nr:BrnT family toxin [Terriglobia bacterium]
METVLRWHPEKARSNLRKHGITFEEAASVFRETLSVTISDP